MAESFSDTVVILSRMASGENGIRYHALSPERGRLNLHRRVSSRKPSLNAPDLFDLGTVHLECAKQGNLHFIREYELIQRREGIPRLYPAFERASFFCQLMEKNLTHAEYYEPLYTLTNQTLDALDAHYPPDAVLFKSLFLFARDEGYPAQQQWLARLPADERQEASRCLKTPLETLTSPPENLPQLIEHLCQWLQNETDILIS